MYTQLHSHSRNANRISQTKMIMNIHTNLVNHLERERYVKWQNFSSATNLLMRVEVRETLVPECQICFPNRHLTYTRPKKLHRHVKQRNYPSKNNWKQLKEWSLHGTNGKDYKINLQNSNSQNAFKNETQQRINETLKNKYDTHNISNSNAPSNVNTAHKLITPVPKLSVKTTVTCDCPCCANCKKEIVTNILEPNETTQENAKSSVGPTTPSFKCYDSCHKITQNQLKRQNSVMSTAKGNTVRAVKRNQKQQKSSEDCKYPSVLAKESEKNITTTSSSSTITRCDVRPCSTSVLNDDPTQVDVDGIAYES
uniref:Uncharacterized protein n=1 Tax=Ceratitis capitata TaxID=7213 RepID=W8BR03_CERCA